MNTKYIFDRSIKLHYRFRLFIAFYFAYGALCNHTNVFGEKFLMEIFSLIFYNAFGLYIRNMGLYKSWDLIHA